MNATARKIVSRLPDRPMLSPGDISAAFGLATTQPILQDIALGLLEAVKVGNRYIVSEEEACRYIVSKSVLPSEGTIEE